MSPAVGRVLGRRASGPLEFWVSVAEDQYLQLDDVICCHSPVGGMEHKVAFYGLVEAVEKLHEGLSFDSDVDLVEEGILPVNTAFLARVLVTRIEPEYYVPPQPGSLVYRATGEQLAFGLYFDQMTKRLPAGLMRNGEPAFLNYEFLCGEKGAHVSVSGISGVATKTSYALFLLYSLFSTPGLGREVQNAHALIFNVKGEDLLYLDKPNKHLSEEHRADYRRLGIEECQPFRSVAFYAPPKTDQGLAPHVSGRLDGISAFVWSMREFAEQELFRYLFAEHADGASTMAYLVDRVTLQLRRLAAASPAGELHCNGSPLRSLRQLAESLGNDQADWFGPNANTNSVHAFLRRLEAAVHHCERLLRYEMEDSHRIDFEARTVTVVDIHNLHPRAQAFVVGAVLKTLFDRKEGAGHPLPHVYVVLDELNKYAPRTGWSPIKDVLLDISERGRSLGILLIGAQQTASEVEPRVVSNSAFRITGRLDAAEGQKAQYDWLLGSFRQRAAMLKPGTMVVHQPELPSPLMVRFPFPAWATRWAEVDTTEDDRVAHDELSDLLDTGQ